MTRSRTSRRSPARALALVATFILLGSGPDDARALPEWSSYRLLSEASRAPIDAAILDVVKKVESDGLVTKRLRFCARSREIWETSIHASCDSTFAAAKKNSWRPELSQDRVSHGWIAFARFITAFCSVRTGEKSCETLGLGSTEAGEKSTEKTGEKSVHLKLPVQLRLVMHFIATVTRAEISEETRKAAMAAAAAANAKKETEAPVPTTPPKIIIKPAKPETASPIGAEPAPVAVPSTEAIRPAQDAARGNAVENAIGNVGRDGGSGERCKVRDDILVTKTGKKIFFDFGVHPSDKHARLLSRIAISAADDRTPDIVLQDGVAELGAMGRVILSNYRKKIPWIKERIANHAVAWIGIDLSENEAGDRTGKKLADDFDDLEAKFLLRFPKQKKKKSMADEDIKNALTYGACPSASACYWLREKSVRRQVRLTPLESNDAKARTLFAEQNEVRIMNELAGLVATSKLLEAELNMIKREYTNLKNSSEPPTPKARESARTRYRVPEVKAAMLALYDNAALLKKNALERRQAVATAALAQGGNGIVSANNTQREALIAVFQEMCEGPKPPKAAARTSIKPTAKTTKK